MYRTQHNDGTEGEVEREGEERAREGGKEGLEVRRRK